MPSTRWPVSAAVIAMRDGFGVAQLADQDDVGVFAHGGAHAFGEVGMCVPSSRWMTWLCLLR